MTSTSFFSSRLRVTGIAASLLILIIAVAAPAAQDQARKVVPVVAPAALEQFVPAALDGWTKVRSTSFRVTDGCAYTFAEAVYTNGDAKLRLTVADTGFDGDALMTVATIVLSFPAGHTETIPPDTVISRITYREYPAATMWNKAKSEGEFTVVVGDRFVVKVESTRGGDVETLRGVLDKIDLKKITELGR
ncbi:MAG TPA: hypothetical protein VJN96_06615 [Vicinamibacterales bacterium]|nr:hypothetical protein [Vicinamibacterales bacterium]